MIESAVLLVNAVLPDAPIRQWELSFPYPLRFLFATRPKIISGYWVWSTGETLRT